MVNKKRKIDEKHQSVLEHKSFGLNSSLARLVATTSMRAISKSTALDQAVQGNGKHCLSHRLYGFEPKNISFSNRFLPAMVNMRARE